MSYGIHAKIKRLWKTTNTGRYQRSCYSKHKSQWAATGHYRSAALQIRDNKDN